MNAILVAPTQVSKNYPTFSGNRQLNSRSPIPKTIWRKASQQEDISIPMRSSVFRQEDLSLSSIHVVNHPVSETSFSGRIRIVKNQVQRLRSRLNILPSNAVEV